MIIIIAISLHVVFSTSILTIIPPLSFPAIYKYIYTDYVEVDVRNVYPGIQLNLTSLLRGASAVPDSIIEELRRFVEEELERIIPTLLLLETLPLDAPPEVVDACGNLCAADEACENGTCLKVCNGVAVDIFSSEEHCGGCGIACDISRETCQGGFCDCKYNENPIGRRSLLQDDGLGSPCEICRNNCAKECKLCNQDDLTCTGGNAVGGTVCTFNGVAGGGLCLGGICFESCSVGSECESGVCTGNICQEPACNDGVKNGDETDEDCGGSCGAKCADLLSCSQNSDCANGFCNSSQCTTPTCSDGFQNNLETGLDCGGPNCPDCDGETCCADTECKSGFCNTNTNQCATPTCSDGFQNGSETGVDCVFGCPKACDTEECTADNECKSGFCNTNTSQCATPTCSDGFQNGSESALDCGGNCTDKCVDGQSCSNNGDCSSGLCKSEICTGLCEEVSCPTCTSCNPSTGQCVVESDGISCSTVSGSGSCISGSCAVFTVRSILFSSDNKILQTIFSPSDTPSTT
jgi:hypothetical protein